MASAAKYASGIRLPLAPLCVLISAKMCQCRRPGFTATAMGRERMASAKAKASSRALGCLKTRGCVAIRMSALNTNLRHAKVFGSVQTIGKPVSVRLVVVTVGAEGIQLGPVQVDVRNGREADRVAAAETKGRRSTSTPVPRCRSTRATSHMPAGAECGCQVVPMDAKAVPLAATAAQTAHQREQ